MIKANFNAYSSYVTDSLHQWDLNQKLTVTGLNLTTAPEVHFSNSNVDRAIVRQAEMLNHVVSVNIPNSLLQDPLRIYAHIGIYEGNTFKVVELVEIPVIPRKRPADYQMQDSDEELYSFKALENALTNKATKSELNAARAEAKTDDTATNARINNIIAHNNDTDGNTELVDLRYGADGVTYPSAGAAVRAQAAAATADAKLMDADGRSTLYKYAAFKNGGLDAGRVNTYQVYRTASENTMRFDKDITLKIADGFRVGVHTVTEDGTFISDSSWRTDECTIPAGTYFKVVIARTAEDTTEKADILAYSNAVTFNTFVDDKLSGIEGTLDVCDKAVTATLASVFSPVGDRFTTNNIAANNRIHAADIVCKGLARIEAKCPGDDYYYGVDLYTNDGLRTPVSQSGWMSAKSNPYFLVEAAGIVDLVICKMNDQSYSSLTEFDGLFEVVNYDALGNLAAEVSKSQKRKAWLTSAHQGFAGFTLPANSLAAFYNAYLHGADMIEVDARLASDGVPVVNHDATISGYTIANTPSSTLCSIVLSEDAKWGTQYVPTLAQVLHLAYNTGLQVNIDLKDGIASAQTVAEMVLAYGMQGKVVYALNGSGMEGINIIMAIDPDARFIDTVENFTTQLTDFAERGKRCYAYTGYASDVPAIRESGCMVALASLNASRFDEAIACYPEMCEYLHTSDFNAIETEYLNNLKLY